MTTIIRINLIIIVVLMGATLTLQLKSLKIQKQMYIINKCQDLGYETGWYLKGEEVCYKTPVK